MSVSGGVSAGGALLFAWGLAQVASPAPELERVQTLDLGPGISAYRLADLTGDGRRELLAADVTGRVRVWGAGAGLANAAGPLDPEARGDLLVADPRYTLLDLARVTPDAGKGLELILLSPTGLVLHRPGADGGFAAEGVRLSRRARFGLRVGSPTFAPFVSDVNRDGLPDVVVPGGQSCELWLNGGAPEGERLPAFRRAARIRVEVQRWGSRASRDLSNVLESSFAVPGLQTRDMNGDARPDLLVIEGQRRAFHLQREDGGYPDEPDTALDLGIFRDDASRGSVTPGKSLSIDGGATFSIRDLDGDGIPDYVIAHRRKVWVFRGSSAGPQFTEPSTILKAAEDVTALTVLELDDDGRPDLLLVKLQVPTIATLVRGLIGEWDVSIQAAGYRNSGEGGFETKARWKSTVVLRLPSIVRILQNPTAFLERLESLEDRFRIAVWGDVEGDGAQDLALLSEQKDRVDLWFGGRGLGQAGGGLSADSALRELLFVEGDRVFDLDRAVVWIGGLAEREVALRTGDRAPDTSIELRDPDAATFTSLDLADLDGDGRAELVVGYRDSGSDGRALFDIHGVR